MKVKICGLSRPADIRCVNIFRSDFIGFVFAKSKRQVSDDQASELKKMLNPEISAVGVFVNEKISRIKKLAEQGIINYVQLHGDEDNAYCAKLKAEIALPVIKAVRVKDKESLLEVGNYSCDYFLFDTYVKGRYGGSGIQFDVCILRDYVVTKPYFIAGGLTAADIWDIKKINPFGIDVSGGVETDGLKDAIKIEEFIKKVRRADNE
ncbi:MAG: phosphoribosylanthranilate isomerase [Phascolarctobacterium sp.]|nr:phosphoribosylanthranilate isomerase [Phascolarctobacterium sp.]